MPRHQLARAISVTNAGGTLAFVLGVPLGTAIGHALGWRLAFGVMAGVVVVFALLVVIFLPPVSHLVSLATGEIAIPAHRDRSVAAVVIVCVTVVVLITGHNIFYTYIAPWAIEFGQPAPRRRQRSSLRVRRGRGHRPRALRHLR